MQRTREQLQAMSHEDLIERILEMQDILREGLAVRDSLHAVLNTLLKVKAQEVEDYASLQAENLEQEAQEVKRAWAAARHAVSNPHGLMLIQKASSEPSP